MNAYTKKDIIILILLKKNQRHQYIACKVCKDNFVVLTYGFLF